jgi:hypothetical protein
MCINRHVYGMNVKGGQFCEENQWEGKGERKDEE